jgi:hypothetical protein
VKQYTVSARVTLVLTYDEAQGVETVKSDARSVLSERTFRSYVPGQRFEAKGPTEVRGLRAKLI